MSICCILPLHRFQFRGRQTSRMIEIASLRGSLFDIRSLLISDNAHLRLTHFRSVCYTSNTDKWRVGLTCTKRCQQTNKGLMLNFPIHTRCMLVTRRERATALMTVLYPHKKESSKRIFNHSTHTEGGVCGIQDTLRT